MRKKFLTLMLVTLLGISSFGITTKAEGEVTASAVATEVTTDVETTFKEEAGITPDSILYPVDKLLDNVKVILSFSDGSKIETLVSIAQERLGESEVMAEAGKDEKSQEALEAFEAAINDANNKLDEVVDQDADSEDIEEDEKVAELEDKVAEQQDSSLKVLERMAETASEKSKEVLARVIEMQTAKKEAVRAMVEARHELNAAKKIYNSAIVELKKAEKSGDDEAITKAQKVLEDAGADFDLKKGEYEAAFEEKQKVIKQYAGNKNAEKEETDTVENSEEASVKAAKNITTKETKPEGSSSTSEAAKKEKKALTDEKKVKISEKKEEAKANAQEKAKANAKN